MRPGYRRGTKTHGAAGDHDRAPGGKMFARDLPLCEHAVDAAAPGHVPVRTPGHRVGIEQERRDAQLHRRMDRRAGRISSGSDHCGRPMILKMVRARINRLAPAQVEARDMPGPGGKRPYVERHRGTPALPRMSASICLPVQKKAKSPGSGPAPGRACSIAQLLDHRQRRKQMPARAPARKHEIAHVFNLIPSVHRSCR